MDLSHEQPITAPYLLKRWEVANIVENRSNCQAQSMPNINVEVYLNSLR